jgi:hypothetical protein
LITPLLAKNRKQEIVILTWKDPEEVKAKVRLCMEAVSVPAAPIQCPPKRIRWACAGTATDVQALWRRESAPTRRPGQIAACPSNPLGELGQEKCSVDAAREPEAAMRLCVCQSIDTAPYHFTQIYYDLYVELYSNSFLTSDSTHKPLPPSLSLSLSALCPPPLALCLSLCTECGTFELRARPRAAASARHFQNILVAGFGQVQLEGLQVDEAQQPRPAHRAKPPRHVRAARPRRQRAQRPPSFFGARPPTVGLTILRRGRAADPTPHEQGRRVYGRAGRV